MGKKIVLDKPIYGQTAASVAGQKKPTTPARVAPTVPRKPSSLRELDTAYPREGGSVTVLTDGSSYWLRIHGKAPMAVFSRVDGVELKQEYRGSMFPVDRDALRELVAYFGLRIYV